MNSLKNDTSPLLEVSRLAVGFRRGTDRILPVKEVSFHINRGEIFGLVGESGSGKSLTALSVLGLLPYPKAFHQADSSIRLNGQELLGCPNLQDFRGSRVGFVFQEPMSSLNPLQTVEHQIAETLILHQKMTARQARRRCLRLLKQTGLQDARAKMKAYPHQLSGGQRQRVMIAIAIANHPDLLIADEPTTALDVTIQAQIIDLLLKLRRQLGMAILFISHDLRLVRQIADRVAVMKDGKIIEQGPVEEIFKKPCHTYTKTLINSFNILKTSKNNEKELLLEADNLTVGYPARRNLWGWVTRWFYALDKVSLQLFSGQTLGIVGESGSGKTTLGLTLSRLINYQGRMQYPRLNQKNLSQRDAELAFRRFLQIVFQDPYNSLNPRMNVAQIVGEGLTIHFPGLTRDQRLDQIRRILAEVGLSEADMIKYPHQFSGGQRQRIALARALILQPQILILDEPTSALDVTIQAQILQLLQKIQADRGLSYILISHDMQAVRAMSDQIAVMKNGRIIEQGPAEDIINAPRADYTRQLIAASLKTGDKDDRNTNSQFS